MRGGSLALSGKDRNPEHYRDFHKVNPKWPLGPTAASSLAHQRRARSGEQEEIFPTCNCAGGARVAKLLTDQVVECDARPLLQ